MTTKLDEKAEQLKTGVGLDEETKAALAAIELRVATQGFTLADAIRMGSEVSEQAYNWGDGNKACALSAAIIAARSKGLL